MTDQTTPAQDKYSKPARARKTRVLAVQAAYSADLNDTPMLDVLAEFQDEHLKGAKGRSADKKLFEAILHYLNTHGDEVDQALTEALQPKWTLERLEAVLRAVLRVAAAEAHLKLTPTPILINEYIQVTNGFFDKDESKLVNAVLDCVTKKIT